MRLPPRRTLPDARSRRARGFTLIELIVVILILASVATVVSVSFWAVLPRTRLHSDVRALASTLRGARSEAIARNARFEVHYDLDANRYWMVTPFAADGSGLALNPEDRRATAYTDLEDGIDFAQVLVDGETYHDGVVLVRFDPLGASNAHTVVLYQEDFDLYHTIEVLPLTGLVRFHEGFWEREPPKETDFD